MRFPFFRNRDSVKNGILISIRRTGDGFHPGLFSVQGNTTDYDFYYGYTDQEMLPLARGLDASLLSSVVNNGFTGTYIGMYTSSNHQPSTNYADFDWFNYQGE